MPEIAFHFNAPDALAHASRVLRKAWGRGAAVTVLGPPATLAALDQALWLLSPGDFVPHSKPGDPPSVQRHSPIRLVSSLDAAPVDAGAVLLNLGDGVPEGYGRFDRVIEIVTLDEADRQAARQRWRRYQADGRLPVRHDLRAPGAG